MSTTHEDGAEGMSWKIKAGIFRGPNPVWAGNRNVAVLCRGAANALILDTGYDLPGTAWRVLMAAAVVVLVTLAIVLKGHPASELSADGVAAIFAIYVVLLWSHHRGMKLDLTNAVSEVVVDEKHNRIALLTRMDDKAGWIVLSEFGGHFADACAAIRDVMGAKCHVGQIKEGNWLPLLLLLAAIVACAVAFGFSVFLPT
jgi:hypothetical protein